MWMVRVHYYDGPLMEFNRRKVEITGLDSYDEAQTLKESGLKHGVRTIQTSDPVYQYWVAPSQIIGFEIIEYEDEE